MKLLEQQAEVGLAPAEVVADQQYAAGELRERARSHGEGTSLVTKAAALPDDGYLHKSEFEIDLEAGTVVCPTGEVAHFAGRFRPGHSTEAVFAAATCGRCPFAIACVRTPGQGRTISTHPYEHQLQAAAERRQQPDFQALMARRPRSSASRPTSTTRASSESLLRAPQDQAPAVLERHRGEHRAADGDWPGGRQPGSGGNGNGLTHSGHAKPSFPTPTPRGRPRKTRSTADTVQIGAGPIIDSRRPSQEGWAWRGLTWSGRARPARSANSSTAS